MVEKGGPKRDSDGEEGTRRNCDGERGTTMGSCVPGRTMMEQKGPQWRREDHEGP